MSLSDILNETARLLGYDFEVSLRIKSTSRGSFEVDLIVMAKDFFEKLIDFFGSKEYDALKKIIELLFGGSASLYGLFKLFKKLRGKKPKAINFDSDRNITVFVLDDESVETFQGVEKLYQSPEIRENAKKFLKPLEKEGLNSIKIKTEMEEELVLEKKDYSSFEMPEEFLSESVETKHFQIVQLSFKEENKWKLSDGTNTFFVRMSDKNFLAKVQNNQEGFFKDSILKVKLKTYQKRIGAKLETEYEVLEVLEHKKPSDELRLIFESS
ncbi:hypothetical protein D9V84_11220 [Bacteroidetes/Chlorobi group bacterium Naka2016]|nr:MAG: hypothetical protein D9V84_11220 [Bacteroidetes/Chlorobi group bacterium Naka2016]